MSEPNESNKTGAARAFDIDFAQGLPPWEFFPVHWLAKTWHCTSTHVIRLIESGELPVGLDLRGKNASRTMIRVPRKSLVQFLNARKNLEAVASKNPRPKYRSESVRRPLPPNEQRKRGTAKRKANA